MLVKELRTKDNNELLRLIDDLKAELFMLRFQNKTGQLDKPHKISQVKKDIAKVFTIINARDLKIEAKINSNKPKSNANKDGAQSHKEVKKESLKEKVVAKKRVDVKENK